MVRRDALLRRIADGLVFWGVGDLDDPGTAELAETLTDLAAQTAADHRHPAFPGAACWLDRAAGELAAADRFRGTLLPVVLRHLRAAETALTRARAHLTDHHHAQATGLRGEKSAVPGGAGYGGSGGPRGAGRMAR